MKFKIDKKDRIKIQRQFRTLFFLEWLIIFAFFTFDMTTTVLILSRGYLERNPLGFPGVAIVVGGLYFLIFLATHYLFNHTSSLKFQLAILLLVAMGCGATIINLEAGLHNLELYLNHMGPS